MVNTRCRFYSFRVLSSLYFCFFCNFHFLFYVTLARSPFILALKSPLRSLAPASPVTFFFLVSASNFAAATASERESPNAVLDKSFVLLKPQQPSTKTLSPQPEF